MSRSADARQRQMQRPPAGERLDQSDQIVALRKAETEGDFVGDVTQHAPLYQQALMSMIWNETYYRWDGSSASIQPTRGWSTRTTS